MAEEGTKIYKIIYDRANCIGAGSCVQACPDNWKMDDKDNKANVLKIEITEAELQKNLEAAQACPVNVIHIEDPDGKRLI